MKYKQVTITTTIIKTTLSLTHTKENKGQKQEQNFIHKKKIRVMDQLPEYILLWLRRFSTLIATSSL